MFFQISYAKILIIIPVPTPREGDFGIEKLISLYLYANKFFNGENSGVQKWSFQYSYASKKVLADKNEFLEISPPSLMILKSILTSDNTISIIVRS